MSAWVIALGLSAGYLINKKLQLSQRLEEQVAAHHSSAQPANPGPRSEEIRNVQRTVPDSERYQDINVNELPPREVQKLTDAREAAHQEVAQYERGPPPIQGVWLNVADRGF